MNLPALPFCVFLTVSAFSYGVAHADANQTTVKIDNGPFAVTYKTPTSPICVRVRTQDVFGSGWKDFDVVGDKALSEVGLGVDHPDRPGAKFGRATGTFGGSKVQTVYYFPTVPVTLEIKGEGGVIRFEGKTKEGISVRIETVCGDVDRQ